MVFLWLILSGCGRVPPQSVSTPEPAAVEDFVPFCTVQDMEELTNEVKTCETELRACRRGQ